MTFHKKPQQAQNHCVFGLMKYMDLLKFMMELDI